MNTIIERFNAIFAEAIASGHRKDPVTEQDTWRSIIEAMRIINRDEQREGGANE